MIYNNTEVTVEFDTSKIEKKLNKTEPYIIVNTYQLFYDDIGFDSMNSIIFGLVEPELEIESPIDINQPWPVYYA